MSPKPLDSKLFVVMFSASADRHQNSRSVAFQSDNQHSGVIESNENEMVTRTTEACESCGERFEILGSDEEKEVLRSEYEKDNTLLTKCRDCRQGANTSDEEEEGQSRQDSPSQTPSDVVESIEQDQQQDRESAEDADDESDEP